MEPDIDQTENARAAIEAPSWKGKGEQFINKTLLKGTRTPPCVLMQIAKHANVRSAEWPSNLYQCVIRENRHRDCVNDSACRLSYIIHVLAMKQFFFFRKNKCFELVQKSNFQIIHLNLLSDHHKTQVLVDVEFRNQLKVTTIKVRKGLSECMTPKTYY